MSVRAYLVRRRYIDGGYVDTVKYKDELFSLWNDGLLVGYLEEYLPPVMDISCSFVCEIHIDNLKNIYDTIKKDYDEYKIEKVDKQKELALSISSGRKEDEAVKILEKRESEFQEAIKIVKRMIDLALKTEDKYLRMTFF